MAASFFKGAANLSAILRSLVADGAIASFGRASHQLRTSVASVRNELSLRPKRAITPSQTSYHSVPNEQSLRPKRTIALSETNDRFVQYERTDYRHLCVPLTHVALDACGAYSSEVSLKKVLSLENTKEKWLFFWYSARLFVPLHPIFKGCPLIAG